LSTEFQTGSNGNYQNSKTTFLDNLSTLPEEKRSDPRTNINISGYLNYFQNVNTNKLQQSLTTGLNAGLDYFKNSYYSKFQDNSSGFEKANGNSIGLNFNITNRFYNEKNNFFLLGGSGNIQTSQREGSSSYKYNGNIQRTNNNSSISLNSEFSLNVGAGKGRLEYVTDPIMATFLIVDLIEKAGIKGVSPEQIENIAKGITQIRNTRFLDFRFRLIDQIEMLDQVLKDNGITSEKAAKYYTTLNDNWLYATQLQRYSGERWEFALNSDLSTNSRNAENSELSNFSPYLNKTDENGIAIRNSFDINYDNYKQSSLKVQKSWGLSLSGFQSNFNNLYQFEDSIGTSTLPYNNKELETNNFNNNILLQGNWQYLFQPNTRTFLTFRANPGIRITDENNTFEDSNPTIFSKTTYKFSGISSTSFLRLNLSYFKFISQNLYFRINANTSSEYSIRNGESVIEVSNSNSTSSKSISNHLLNSYQLIASLNYLIF
jgi:hypothetical protein